MLRVASRNAPLEIPGIPAFERGRLEACTHPKSIPLDVMARLARAIQGQERRWLPWMAHVKWAMTSRDFWNRRPCGSQAQRGARLPELPRLHCPCKTSQIPLYFKGVDHALSLWTPGYPLAIHRRSGQ
jgi:hypothetical protein